MNVGRRDLQPTTAEAISSACSKRSLGWMPHIVCCDQWPRAILHEIGRNPHTQGPVLLYFHGGGYVSPLHEATHMPLIFKLAKALHDGTGRTFVLEYGLAPGLKYPGQLVQSACALNYLLTDLACELEQIVIAGDGSGGNLALALLVHIGQVHPLVPKIVDSPRCDRLKGALLVNPWVSLTCAAASYERNTMKDWLTVAGLEECKRLWNPEQARWSDFADMPAYALRPMLANRILFTVGSFEIFRDDVKRLAKKIGAGTDKSSPIKSLQFEEAVHLQAVVDEGLGLPLCKSLRETLLRCRCLCDGGDYYVGLNPETTDLRAL
jgi:acetyl esterase/lipase